jgi:hypothetical protein
MPKGKMPGRKLTADDLNPHREGARAQRLRLHGVRAWLLEWVPPTVYDRTVAIQDVPVGLRRVACILSSRHVTDAVAEVAAAIYLSPACRPLPERCCTATR